MKTVLHRLNQIKNPKDFWLLVRVTGWAYLLPILIRYMKLPGLLYFLNSKKSLTPDEPKHIEKTVYFVDFVLRKGKMGRKNWCLKRSLMLYHFLGADGIPVEVNFGIRKTGNIEGHAWLTRNGSVYLDSDLFTSEYVVIYSSGSTR